jgi:tetratricopeptide (TPR) repeat protein
VGNQAHGMACGGIIAATQDNNTGISGIAPNSKLMFLKISDAWGKFTTPDIEAQAFDFARVNNADVISCSWGGGTPTAILNDAINRAITQGRDGKGCIVVFASGNNGSIISYPGNLPDVITVGAIDRNNNIWSYSNIGPELELVAPSGTTATREKIICEVVSSAYSYIPPDYIEQPIITLNGDVWTTDIAGEMGLNPQGFNECIPPYYTVFRWYVSPIAPEPDYTANFGGTSAAAPQFAGVVALILAINPDLTLQQITNILNNSADDLGQTGFDNTFGWGRVNAFKSLKYTLENYGGTLTQDLTIPAGETWNFAPGVTVKFALNTSLIVNGTLNAVGNSSNKITFDRSGTTGTWGSITFNGSAASGSILDNVEIKYALDVKCLNGTDVTIQNSLIDHCTQGIYVYNSQPQILNNQILEPVQNGIYCNALGKIPLIQNNTITKTSSNMTFRNYQGIWLENHTSSYIAHNDISGFYWGIYVGGGSYGLFTNHSLQVFYPNNRIMNNLLGFAAGWGSGIAAGIGMVYCWNNSIFNNVSFDVYSYQSSSITAQYNYWGGSSPKQYVDGTSHLDVSQFLTSDPWGGTLALNSQEIINSDTYNSISPLYSINDNSLFSDIYMTINLETTGKVEEAINLYKKMLEKNGNTNFALTSLARIKTQYDRNDLLDYFITLSTTETTYKNIVQKILAGLFLQDNEYVKALNLYDEIIKSNQNNYEGVSARFEKFFAALNYKSDKKAAAKLLSEISLIKLTEEELISQKEFAVYLLYGSVESDNKLNKESNESTNSDNSVIANDYTLNQNYPNPFNSSTMINYSIKDEGLVKLIIYDILGREIASLVKEIKEAGYHSVEFNASQLPSGVYIYTLQVNGFSASRKMLLLK